MPPPPLLGAKAFHLTLLLTTRSRIQTCGGPNGFHGKGRGFRPQVVDVPLPGKDELEIDSHLPGARTSPPPRFSSLTQR